MAPSAGALGRRQDSFYDRDSLYADRTSSWGGQRDSMSLGSPDDRRDSTQLGSSGSGHRDSMQLLLDRNSSGSGHRDSMQLLLNRNSSGSGHRDSMQLLLDRNSAARDSTQRESSGTRGSGQLLRRNSSKEESGLELGPDGQPRRASVARQLSRALDMSLQSSTAQLASSNKAPSPLKRQASALVKIVSNAKAEAHRGANRAFETREVFGAGRGAAAGRDVDSPRAARSSGRVAAPPRGETWIVRGPLGLRGSRRRRGARRG